MDLQGKQSATARVEETIHKLPKRLLMSTWPAVCKLFWRSMFETQI